MTFEHTGDVQDWTVPYGVSSATFELSGAQGRGFAGQSQGGNGGWARATIAVTPATTIRVMVGGAGVANAGGFNGGGGGGNGGGGATDVRLGGTALTDRVLVAAGGGGTGGCVGLGASSFGGAGGGVTGWAGTDPQCGSASPGSGATQSEGGSNGGSLGQGGPGTGGAGGGGGGGYYGGGGGGSGGPGGGGSSFGPPGYLTSSGIRSGDGVATVTYEVTQRQTLRTSAVGEGDGYVSSSPAGIDCGFEDDPERDVCLYEFGQDQPVTVTAHPAPGTEFDQWIAGCTGSTQPTCSTTMSALRTVSARFKHGPRALAVSKSGNGSGTVASAPAGIDCGPGCSADYAYGTSVTLTATPATGSDFIGWTGSCTGTTTTCTVTMDQVQDVGAEFTLEQYRLRLAKFENGAGTVVSDPAGIDCGPSCDDTEATFDYGTSVTLTATGAFGSDFTDWGGVCQPVEPGQDCVISMTADRYAEVAFVLQRHALDVVKTGSGSGSVTSAPGGIDCGADCTDLFEHGTLVTLTASPGEHSLFTGWSGPCTGTSATCTVTIDQAREVEAAFALETRTLTTTTAGNGSGSVGSQPAGLDCGSSCSAAFDHGTSVTLTATPAAGSDFADWTGACTGVTATCTVTMDQARTVEATFTLQKRTLTITTTGNGAGTITPTPAGTAFDYGTTVTLTATPATGSDFTGWTGACTGTTTTCTITMDQARDVTARFADRRPVVSKLNVILSKRRRGATRVSVTVSEAATVRFRLTRRSTKALTFDRKLAKAGTSTFTLPAKLRKQLKRGQYNLTAVATDSAGQKSAAKRVRRALVK